MDTVNILILLACVCAGLAGHSDDSEHSHLIPVEGYETELQDLGQHVEIPEHPVKLIKITKTVAVKVPVPYPVKVIQKVPYPVHVHKPYPVPVPQLVKVPHVVTVAARPHEHRPHGAEEGPYAGDHQEHPASGDEHQAYGGGDTHGEGYTDHGEGYAEPSLQLAAYDLPNLSQQYGYSGPAHYQQNSHHYR